MKKQKHKERSMFTCTRCGYTWLQRFPGAIPKVCANKKCKSPYWSKKRGSTIASKVPKKSETVDYTSKISELLHHD